MDVTATRTAMALAWLHIFGVASHISILFLETFRQPEYFPKNATLMLNVRAFVNMSYTHHDVSTFSNIKLRIPCKRGRDTRRFLVSTGVFN